MKFDLEHWVPLFFLCVVNKPPHEHDLCRWPRLDPLIVGVCAGVRASVCAGQVGAFSQLDARRPSLNPNPRPSQTQLPAITIQVRSRSQSYRYSSTHLRTLTARSPLGTPQNTCHNPTKAPLKPHPIRHVRYTIYHTHIASTCAFCPPSGNRQTAIPNTQYQYPCQMQLQINAPCGGFFPKRFCGRRRSCQKWVCNWNSLLAKQHTRKCGDQVQHLRSCSSTIRCTAKKDGFVF